MAEVFRAKPFNAPEGRRYLALKRILPHLAEDDEFIKMFIDEARLTVQLRHPNIVQIYELGQFQSSYYILMEYIAGHDLLALQKLHRRDRTVMNPAQACFITMELSRGMDYAHRKLDANGNPLGIIHRDISPQNVLISFDGEVKVIDFGIAKAAVQSTHTQIGVLKGKFGYMSPEQVNSQPIDHRSDVFAIGVLFWELLTNRRLFRGESEIETIQMLMNPKIEPPSSIVADIPPEVDRIVMKALATNRDERYSWASELADDLQAYLDTLTPPYERAHLARWMEGAFAEDFAAESEKHEFFRTLREPDDVIALHLEEIADDTDGDTDSEAADVPPDGATRVWEGDFAPGQGENYDEFVANHTVVQAGGFDLESFLHEQAAGPASGQPGEPVAPVRVGAQHMAKLGTQPRAEHPFAPGVSPQARAQVILAFVAVLVFVTLSATVLYMMFGQNDSTTAASVATTDGTVVVSVVPPRNIEIFVSGIARGTSAPVTVEGLQAGVHLIEVRGAGHETSMQTVEVRPGAVVPVQVELTPIVTAGKLRLQLPATEGLAIYLNGEAMSAERVAEAIELDAGKHLLEAIAPEHRPYSRFVDIEAGVQHEVSVLLEPLDLSRVPVIASSDTAKDVGWMTVQTGADWWQVVIDGVDTGLVTPIALDARVPLAAGTRTVTLRRGDQSRDLTVEIEPGETVVIRENLPFRMHAVN